MKILVDADACPVKSIIVNLAKKYNIEVVMFSDTSHIIEDGYSKIVVVDKSNDSADIRLINNLEKSDIVVTQDYGVASMALGKGASAINQNGLIYSNENIDMLMFERFLSSKSRRAGMRTKGPKKRIEKDNEKFTIQFEKLINKQL